MATIAGPITFETGDLSQWGNGTFTNVYSLAAVAGAARNGSYGMRATAASASDTAGYAIGIQNFTTPATLVTVLEAEMRFSSWTSGGYDAAGSKAVLFLGVAGVNDAAWLGVRASSTLELCYNHSINGATASGITLALTVNTWYRHRLIYNKTAGSVTWKYSTDGGANWTTAGTVSANVAALNVDQAIAGIVHMTNFEKAQYTVDIDDVTAFDAEPSSGGAAKQQTLALLGVG
jgi:hypothetical protein